MNVDPRSLEIVDYPAPVLRQRAQTIERVDDHVRAVARRMIELMYEAEGIGLAAPQVGLPWRLFVVDVPENDQRRADASPPSATRGPMVYVNPELTRLAGAPEPSEEGCLSLPEIRGEVLRPPLATISALDEEGRPVVTDGAGLLARCWQHEFDHLEGILIIDRMTQLSRLKNRSAVRGLERAYGR